MTKKHKTNKEQVQDALSALGFHVDSQADIAEEICRIRDESRSLFHQLSDIQRKESESKDSLLLKVNIGYLDGACDDAIIGLIKLWMNKEWRTHGLKKYNELYLDVTDAINIPVTPEKFPWTSPDPEHDYEIELKLVSVELVGKKRIASYTLELL